MLFLHLLASEQHLTGCSSIDDVETNQNKYRYPISHPLFSLESGQSLFGSDLLVCHKITPNRHKTCKVRQRSGLHDVEDGNFGSNSRTDPVA